MATVKIKDADLNDIYYDVSGSGTLTNPYKSNSQFSLGDSANLDAFGRLRVSNPTAVFDAQLTYNLQPSLFEQITDLTGATVTHDSTNRCALMTFSTTPVNGEAYMQSYEHFRYQPGKSQMIFVTFNFIEQIANALKFAGYSDGVNGIEFQNNGTTNQFKIFSGTDNGDQIVTQTNWNLDKLDGTGTSGITLDITKTQILVIDFEALYVGRVRIGFNINGTTYYAHEFNHANIATDSYIQSANLPIRAGMIAKGTVSTTMKYICCNVTSEGGQQLTASYDFAQGNNVTAGNGTDTHLMSIRPRATFNGITNRVKFGFIELDLLVTGTNPVIWKLVLGQALTGASYVDVNTTYSAAEYDVTGTLSGSPSIVINQGYIAASTQVKGATASKIFSRYPITLDAAGVARDLGTLTLIVNGIGGTSVTYGTIKWIEIR